MSGTVRFTGQCSHLLLQRVLIPGSRWGADGRCAQFRRCAERRGQAGGEQGSTGDSRKSRRKEETSPTRCPPAADSKCVRVYAPVPQRGCVNAPECVSQCLVFQHNGTLFSHPSLSRSQPSLHLTLPPTHPYSRPLFHLSLSSH